MKTLLKNATLQVTTLAPKLAGFAPQLEKLGKAMLKCWKSGGKVLTCGNGGSCADAIHLAEELMVRFAKHRKALAAIALADGSAITCAGNDYGIEQIFSRQVDALGNKNDILVVFTTSGNSVNIIEALKIAKKKRLTTAAFLGKTGGKVKGMCDIEIIVPHELTHRIQEAHLILYHTLCEWVDTQVK